MVKSLSDEDKSFLTQIKHSLSRPAGQLTDILMVVTLLLFVARAWVPVVLKGIAFSYIVRTALWFTSLTGVVATAISVYAEPEIEEE